MASTGKSKSSQPTGGASRRTRSSTDEGTTRSKSKPKSKAESQTPYKPPVSREELDALPHLGKVPSLSEVEGFLMVKGQSEGTELPPNPRASALKEMREKVCGTQRTPPNESQEDKEIPFIEEEDSEEKVPKKRRRKGKKERRGTSGSGSQDENKGKEDLWTALTQLEGSSVAEHFCTFGLCTFP